MNSKSFKSSNELRRTITSLAILISIIMQSYYRKGDWYSIIKSWTMYATYANSACIKSKYSYKKCALPSVGIAIDEILRCLHNVSLEVKEREYVVEGNALIDFIFYKNRRTLLIALMALYWFWGEEKGWYSFEDKEVIENFIPLKIDAMEFWGEAVIPQLLAHVWYLKDKVSTQYPEYFLSLLLDMIIRIKLSNNNKLFDPYYTFSDYVAWRYIPSYYKKFEQIEHDFSDKSYFSETLLRMLARSNLKQTCKEIYPQFSKIHSVEFRPSNDWSYCLYRSETGSEVTKIHSTPKKWSDLLQESRDARAEFVPEPLKSNIFLLMLHIIIFPYRATPSVLGYLDLKFNGTWFIPDPPLE